MRRTIIGAGALSSAVLVIAAVTSPVAGASSPRVCPSVKPGCPYSSIQAAVNGAGMGATISIAPGTYRENVAVGQSAPTSITLIGEGGPGAVIVNGQQRDSVLIVGPGSSANVVGLTLTNGLAGGAGGGNGGGILNFGGTVSVINSRIVNNSANGSPENNAGNGGGIFSIDTLPGMPAAPGAGTLSLTDTLVTGNTASSGGGVSSISFTAAARATIVGSTIAHNTATGGGAGGVQNCGTLTMTSSSISNNTAPEGAGLTNCGNPPSGPSGNARLVNTPVTGNHAVGGTAVPGEPGGPENPPAHGGGISNGGTLTLISSPVIGNTAVGPGGGIYNANIGTVNRTNSPVTGNTGVPPAQAQCGGASQKIHPSC